MQKIKTKLKRNLCVDYLGNELINYNSNDGRQIKIYNGALGLHRQPNQLVITHMFGHLFDLIISIEGYNEHQSLDEKIEF